MLYKFLVIDEHDMQLGTFDCLKNALIFIDGFFEKYYEEPTVKLIIKRVRW